MVNTDDTSRETTEDFRLGRLTPTHNRVALAVELVGVVPDRCLYLESVHWQSEGPLVVLYRVTPGITEQQMRTQGGARLHWRGELADDLGTDYGPGLDSGGIGPSATTSIGDRGCPHPPPPEARFLAITIATPRRPGHPHGEERATVFAPLHPGDTHRTAAFAAAVTAWRQRRDRGCHALLQHYATTPDGPLPSATPAEIAAWTRRLRRHALLHHPGKPTLTPRGWQALSNPPQDCDLP